MDLKFYNTLTRTKETFVPIDPANVRMYVCGPTVYDYAHIGNARPAIVFDVLFRLLRHVYGEDHVTYARNITDVDDKIIERAARDGVSIDELTKTTADQYHADVAALGCLPPTHEPRATKHIGDMVAMIEKLIERGHAYASDGHVLFDTASMPDYGKLAKRSLDEMISGARVEVASYKKNATDFVLWKPSADDQPGWESPWGRGRPGWHIECSAMSAALLGETFDIHGGGIDLAFPHHENEVAQSRCAHGTPVMANVWMHNGFLQVEGQKMSKSLGNFITINELLRTEKFGGRPWHGGVLRHAMLKTHYRQPIDWTVSTLEESRKELERWADIGLLAQDEYAFVFLRQARKPAFSEKAASILADDLNTPALISYLRECADSATRDDEFRLELLKNCHALGLFDPAKVDLYRKNVFGKELGPSRLSTLFGTVELMRVHAANGSIQLLQQESEALKERGIEVDYRPQSGIIEFSAPKTSDDEAIQEQIKARLAARAEKNWAEADRIRDELAGKGIQLKDGKDPETGAPVTTWEVVR